MRQIIATAIIKLLPNAGRIGPNLTALVDEVAYPAVAERLGLVVSIMSAGKNMNPDHPEDFSCPQCQARYKIVRMTAEPGLSYLTLQCRVCREPLASTEGDTILKYFLVSRPRAPARRPSANLIGK